MEKFIVTGYTKDRTKFCLSLPTAKHFKDLSVNKTEVNSDRAKDILNSALKRKKSSSYHLPVSWFSHDVYVEKVQRPLHQILSRYDYPLSQGPVLLPIDCSTEDKLSADEVISARTLFSHSDSQKCSEWTFDSRVDSAWGNFKVQDLRFSIQGAASMTHMGLVYTCSYLKCVIDCPCHVCQDRSKNCKLQCRNEVCNQCNSQCIQHEIKLPRLFNVDTDHFTMVTKKIDKYQFAYAYAGIPLSCDKCSQDVWEHQVFHLVFHKRCRFCRHEMQPFEQNSCFSLEEYKKAEQILKTRADRTCSFCLVQCQDSYARSKHEGTVHFGKENKFKCTQCEKNYSNINALQYHESKHKTAVIKPKCDLCGFQCATNGTLMRHKEVIHSDGSQKSKYFCQKCDIGFSRKDNFNCHNKEQHYENKANFNYVEDLDKLAVINCNMCDQTFKKMSNLKRHVKFAHTEDRSENNFNCSQCDRIYSRKDHLTRHMKLKHS